MRPHASVARSVMRGARQLPPSALPPPPHRPPAPLPPAGKPADEQAYEMGTFLLRNRELVRCERKFKKPPPGQDRPAKFPKRLLHVAGPEASVRRCPRHASSPTLCLFLQ